MRQGDRFRRGALLFTITLALMLIVGVLDVRPTKAADPVDIQVGLVKFQADGSVNLGGSLVRLEGNVRVGHVIHNEYIAWLGVASSLTVDLANQVVTEVQLGGEFGIYSGIGTYIGTSGSISFDIPSQIVTINSSLRMPFETPLSYVRIEGEWVLNLPNRSLEVHGKVYDDSLPLSESWPIMEASLNLEAFGESACFMAAGEVMVEIPFTDKISIDPGARINICPEAGYYLVDLDLSILHVDARDFVSNLEIDISPALEALMVEIDSANRRITFRGAAGIAIPGVDIDELGLEVDIGTVLTWDPWTWSGELDLGIGVLEYVELKATNLAFDFDFDTAQFEFTNVSEFRVGDWFGVRAQANETHLSLNPVALSGRGQFSDFDGAVNPLAGTEAWTSFLLNFAEVTFAGGFENNFDLLGFPISAAGGGWALTPAGVSFSYSTELLAGLSTDFVAIAGPHRLYGTVGGEIHGPFNIVIASGSAFTWDRIGITLNVEMPLITFTVIVRPDLQWIVDRGVLGTAGGLDYLSSRHSLYSNGSWGNDVGITGLAVLAYLNFGFDEGLPDVNNAIQYIRSNANADGSIYSNSNYRTYHTSMAILALKATHNPAYFDEIEAAKNWLVASQWDESCLWGSVQPWSWYYGGFGYGRNVRPDLSNTQWALLALHAAGVPDDDPMWTKALTFVSRTQNWITNDQSWAATDGGFIYFPGSSLVGGTTSYGSMTGAGIWSLALIGLEPTESRFDAALDWVQNRYTWEYNPTTYGSWGANGLYYYYVSMAKALTMARQTRVGTHDWFYELASELIDRQQADGRWYNADGDFWESNPELVTAYAVLALETRTLNPNEDLRLVIMLHSPADLHLYDPEGRHTGMNYETGEVDLEIPGSSYSPDDPQTVSIEPPVAGNYTVQLVGTDDGTYELEIIGQQDQQTVSSVSYIGNIAVGEIQGSFLNLTAIEGALTIFSTTPEALPTLALEPSALHLSGVAGQTVEAEFVAKETGGSEAIQGINIYASDMVGSGGGIIPRTSIAAEPSSFDLEAGASMLIAVSIHLDSQVVPGTYSGSITVESVNAGARSIQMTVEVISNLPPSVDAGPDQMAYEGDTVCLPPAAFIDPNIGDTHIAIIDWGDGLPEEPGIVDEDAHTVSGCHAYADNGSYVATVGICDNNEACATDDFTVDVANAVPAVGPIDAPLEPNQVNTSIQVSADFADPGILDTHTALWDWGDGATSVGLVTEGGGSGSVSGEHVYGATGVHTIKLTVTDNDGDSGESTFSYIVIYDPNGGFVTGGGWIFSPEGAYTPEPDSSGFATFGFVSKYLQGQTVPSGETEFHFNTASNFKFHSTDYEWLVVSKDKAMYMGTGSVNGEEGYSFKLWAIDGDLIGSDGIDKFRIKIWYGEDETQYIYDNQFGAPDFVAPTTALESGSIIIHGTNWKKH